ncbi:MAG TPA: hypothetical protein VN817_10105, partial [Solirubrobacteraceae bacterium]|nr:hypothetical protein [Solirubrobacteraceae bacterium]
MIAAYAIWQAWTIFRISSATSREAERTTTEVGESVRKLQGAFDHLRNDTLSLLRDMIEDMR